MSDKVATDKGARRGGMLPLLSRLLAVLALVLMPVTMTAPASAAEHGQVEALMPCDGHEQPSQSAPDRRVHCTSCVAVAEPGVASPDALLEPTAILADPDQRLLLGILLEVATPPPRAT
jgi:hypothetical protein